MSTEGKRRQSIADLKRALILGAAQRVLERDGLDGASLRAIAAEAGYTPAALYFHFDSKEALYADLLGQSLSTLADMVEESSRSAPGGMRFTASALAFFDFYANRPRELDLGFYLFRGGMRRQGLGRDRDRALNTALERALAPVETGAREVGASPEAARAATASVFGHAVGLLMMQHTGRARVFGLAPRALMQDFVALQFKELSRGAPVSQP